MGWLHVVVCDSVEATWSATVEEAAPSTEVAAAGQEQRPSTHVVPHTPQMAGVVGVASLNTGSDATGADVIVVSQVQERGAWGSSSPAVDITVDISALADPWTDIGEWIVASSLVTMTTGVAMVEFSMIVVARSITHTATLSQYTELECYASSNKNIN